MKEDELVAAAVTMGYWLVRADASVGKRVDGVFAVVQYAGRGGRVEFAYTDALTAARSFILATAGATPDLQPTR